VNPFPLVALKLLVLFAAPDPSSFAEVFDTKAPHTCRWSFPGGTPVTSTFCAPPAVRYRTPGVKTVTLTVCAAYPHGPCTTVTKPLTVLDPRPVVAGLKTNPLEPYVGDTLHLTATASGKPPFTWLWNLPGAATATTNPAVLETARLAPGLLTLKVRATNSAGSAMRTLYVRLLDPKPILTGLSLSTTTPAVGSLLTASPNMTGRQPLTFRWTLDGQTLGTERTLSWQVVGVAPGQHNLALRVANAAGAASLSRTVTVQQPQILDFRPVCPNLICLFSVDTPVAFDLVLAPSAQPTRFEYDWTGNGPFTEASPTPVSSHIYMEPGNYRPRVRVTTAAGFEIHAASQFLLVTRGGP
jgi:PKD repeat protein